MTDSPIRGATAPAARRSHRETFDRAHGTTAKNALLWRLAREAYGDEYPEEIQAWGMTTWWTLGQFISGLRVGPGQRLVDLACGRAGVGLWLARATGAQLTGVDWSPVAVAEATAALHNSCRRDGHPSSSATSLQRVLKRVALTARSAPMPFSSQLTESRSSRRWRGSCDPAADSSSRPTRATTLTGNCSSRLETDHPCGRARCRKPPRDSALARRSQAHVRRVARQRRRAPRDPGRRIARRPDR